MRAHRHPYVQLELASAHRHPCGKLVALHLRNGMKLIAGVSIGSQAGALRYVRCVQRSMETRRADGYRTASRSGQVTGREQGARAARTSSFCLLFHPMPRLFMFSRGCLSAPICGCGRCPLLTR